MSHKNLRLQDLDPIYLQFPLLIKQKWEFFFVKWEFFKNVFPQLLVGIYVGYKVGIISGNCR